MHILASREALLDSAVEAVDLEQTPGAVVVISSAETDLLCLAQAWGARDGLRLANMLDLQHPSSVDLYCTKTLVGARVVLVRLLGGESAWSYGVGRLVSWQREVPGREVIFVPADGSSGHVLKEKSTVDVKIYDSILNCFHHGGVTNFAAVLRTLEALGTGAEPALPVAEPVPRMGVYAETADWAQRPAHTGVAVVFYRALLLAGQMGPVDGLIEALEGQGLWVRAVYVHSLKESAPEEVLDGCALVVNATGFAAGTGVLDGGDRMVVQVAAVSESREDWEHSARGLTARSLAMYVMLPELDGRVFSRPIAFKSRGERDPWTQCMLAPLVALEDRCVYVAALVTGWLALRRTPPAERKVALVLSNYPLRDGRIANGVGLDTPWSVLKVLEQLCAWGYHCPARYEGSAELIEALLDGPTNAHPQRVRSDPGERLYLPRQAYERWADRACLGSICARWGSLENDPLYCQEQKAFRIPALRLGHVVILLQPARGYQIDPEHSYHDPDLVPPHGYYAAYLWLRQEHQAQVLVHMGKHGTLEWLPGKGVGLSGDCYPERMLGPLPVLYPFIANDPGEGSQAKRRTAAVIVDHLPPPLARAESYGVYGALEQMLDEYALADSRRRHVLEHKILDQALDMGLDRDCGWERLVEAGEKIQSLDGFLCTLKELQIKDGLHVFGAVPEGGLRSSTLLALVRLDRGQGAGDRSLLRALAEDCGLEDDPLDPHDLGAPHRGAKPAILASLGDELWRSRGDTVERLEALALALIEGRAPPPGPASAAVLKGLEGDIAVRFAQSGEGELSGLKDGLEGRFVPPGPSGAPSRGHCEVLPTGRNFYSCDSRMLPTPSAWQLGFRSAQLLVEEHIKHHGEAPRCVALSAWGTSNMRTGGDDIAQALGLIGAQPVWDSAAGRVMGIEVIPHEVLGRPRVDVVLRVSGFFRDAFPGLIGLFHHGVKTVAAEDESERVNPIRSRVLALRAQLEAKGVSAEESEDWAVAAVFGSRPGSYGAGLQAHFHEGDEVGTVVDDGALAESVVRWGGYLYGGRHEGREAHALFRERLSGVTSVVHNQDNREHDLLDSDDYYQFQGGLMATVRHIRGENPAGWFNDHSRPEYPMVQPLEREIGRVVRGRVAHPKWIAGMRRHGYKGAFEMAASVDYLFAYAVTTHSVSSAHFDAVFDAYIVDEEVRDFLAQNNPDALRNILERFETLWQAGMWKPRRNDAHRYWERAKEAQDTWRDA